MPTAVSAARQCLAGEAAAALDEGVAVARRRGHAQTTSLHVVSAMLSAPSFASPLLRDALARAARGGGVGPARLQFKALELCFSVALDRLPSSQPHHPPPPDDPPVSNSLMAAIKRSQANQRRNPDTFHLYQQQQQGSSSSSFTGVKVELQQLVLAILDDPLVSRVFGDAGFRSCDIKLAVLRPPPPILRFPRAARCPPLFLCSFSSAGDGIDAFGHRPFPFPLPAQLSPDGADENCRRIGEILLRKSGSNPILVGFGAADAARDFTNAIDRRDSTVIPAELRGLKVISAGDKMGGLQGIGESPGVVISIGDLMGMVEGEEEKGQWVVEEVTRAMESHRGRVWVMGWSATYETYMKFLSRFPSLDKDLDLQLLPITSVKPAGFIPRPQSVMGSFVPFGGFFPTTCESKNSLSSPYQSAVRCQQCNEGYDQEVAALRKGCSGSIRDQHQSNLPAWLEDAAKAKDDKTMLNAKVMDLQKKWNDNCQRLHHGFHMLETDNLRSYPHIVGLQHVSNKEGVTEGYPSQGSWRCSLPMTRGLQMTAASQSMSLPAVTEPKRNNFLSALQARGSKSEQLQQENLRSHAATLSYLGMPNDQSSPTSVTSVRTDLVLGTTAEPPCEEEKSPSQKEIENRQKFSGFLESNKVGLYSRRDEEVMARPYGSPSYPDSPVKVTCVPKQIPIHSNAASRGFSAFEQSSLSSSNLSQQFDPRDYKSLFRSIIEKVGRQEEAICSITEAIARCKSGHQRRRGASLKGDIWLSFLGPDKVGKKKTALALAESIFGSRDNFVCIDLSLHDDSINSNSICGRQAVDACDSKFRGKTVTDHIASEISKKPWSIVFLENVDKADLLVQGKLSQAIQIGKFSDSYGREHGINNAIFVLTAKAFDNKALSQTKQGFKFSEEMVLAAQCCQMRMSVASVPEVHTSSSGSNIRIGWKKDSGNKSAVSKRKLGSFECQLEQLDPPGNPKRTHKEANSWLDLNLPFEESVARDPDHCSNDDISSLSENSEEWLQEFFSSMDKTVNFEPFDFDVLGNDILMEIASSFHETIGYDCILEVDERVMEQILAATWVSEDRGALHDWLANVLRKSFTEVRQRCSRLLTHETVVRLVACEEAFMKEQAPGILLPSRIIF